MPRSKTYPTKKRGRPVCGDPNDPEGMYVWMRRYLEALQVKNYAPSTLNVRELLLLRLIEWLEARGIARPVQVTKPILERYQRHLFHYRTANGRPLSFRNQSNHLVAVRGYFRWLAKQNVILANPASELEFPRKEQRLPKYILTRDEAEKVLSEPDLTDPLGVRDRALMEVLYATGIRRGEVIGLTIFDIDRDRETLMVRRGKGNRQRVVPLLERAVLWVDKYVHDIRPGFVVPPDDGALFLTALGEPLTAKWTSALVRRHVKSAIDKPGSCHLFRHTMATLMLENGADIRHIQEILGHRQLSSTQLYTQVSIKKLCAVHRATHPGAAWPGVKKAEPKDAETKTNVST